MGRFLILLIFSTALGCGTPVLWTSPKPSVLVSGIGPKPRPPFRFIKEEKGGTNPKVWVRDARGVQWIVKWGPEVHSDTFGSRLAAAAGYYSAPVFFLEKGRILGIHGLDRAKQAIGKGGFFDNASFKLVDASSQYTVGGWRWDRNPFLGSARGKRQLNGLKILMMLTSNWDGKDARDGSEANTAIFQRANVQYYL